VRLDEIVVQCWKFTFAVEALSFSRQKQSATRWAKSFRETHWPYLDTVSSGDCGRLREVTEEGADASVGRVISPH
jgi:hypothetical protein